MKIDNCARCGGDHDEVHVMTFTRPVAPPEIAPMVWSQWAQCPTTGDPIMIAHVEPGTPVSTFDEALEAAYWMFDALRKGTHAPRKELGLGPQAERDAFKAVARELFSKWGRHAP